jgi:membrane-associated protein
MDPAWLLERFGTDVLRHRCCVIVFIECGLLFPILPGDSLLFSVGMFINRAEAGEAGIHMSIWLACAAAVGVRIRRQRRGL